MKRSTRIGLIILAVSAVCITAFTVATPSPQQVIERFFLRWAENNYTPDSSAVKFNIQSGSNSRIHRLWAFSYSPVYLENDLFGIVAFADTAYEFDNGSELKYSKFSLNESAKRLTGSPLVRTWRPAWGWEPGKRRNMSQFDSTGLRKLFLKFYKRPTEGSVQGYTYQVLYDTWMRDWARQSAEIISTILAHRAAFDSACKRYEQEAYLDPNRTTAFDGIVWQTENLPRVIGQAEVDRFNNLPRVEGHTWTNSAYGYSDRWFGIMMRRKMDGSLPTCLSILRTILKDYDPEFARTMNPRLVY